MNTKFHYILYFTVLMSCQTGNLQVIFDISSNLKEVSAIETVSNSDLLWIIEDAGNKNDVYGLDLNGSISKTITVTNVKNNDWEDLTSDSMGNLYIGDFGNNKKKLSPYSIYKIVSVDTIMDKTTASSINFTLPSTIKPKDFEAFFLLNDTFYLFSKSNKFCQLFKVPNTIGNHTSELISEYKFDGDYNKITSADISQDGKIVSLLTHDKIWILSDFKADDFFSGKIESQMFNHDSQKEGVCFKNNKTLFITEESDKGYQSNLYEYIID